MKDTKNFLKNNLNGFHVAGILLGVGLSMIYWAKVGRFADTVLKSNPFLMALWGILVGYILFDFIYLAVKRKKKDE